MREIRGSWQLAGRVALRSSRFIFGALHLQSAAAAKTVVKTGERHCPSFCPTCRICFFFSRVPNPFACMWTRLQAFHQRSPTLYFQFYALQTLDKQQMVGGPLKYSRVLICAIAH